MLSPLALLACASCGGPERPLSVLLVSLDTTRADRIGAYGYAHAGTPNLDALAARGVLFEHAYAPVPLTLPSHTSLLTGAGPRTHGVRDNGRFKVHSGMTTLAELAAARGYRTAAFVAAFPLSSQFGLDQGFELYDDEFGSHGQVMAQRDGAVVAGRAQSWLQTLSRDESFLLWTHFFDPHWPYEASEPFASQHAGDPYQAEIAYAHAHHRKLHRRARIGLKALSAADASAAYRKVTKALSPSEPR